MSTKIIDVWKPDTCKKPFVSVRRISEKGKFISSSAFNIK